MCIYIYREREITHVCIYIYIYTYIHTCHRWPIHLFHRATQVLCKFPLLPSVHVFTSQIRRHCRINKITTTQGT